jgi:hypothetical protein
VRLAASLGRAELVPNGDPVELTPELPQLVQVCAEFELTLA